MPRKSFFDWREFVIRSMHASGALGLVRRAARSLEIPPGASLTSLRFRKAQTPKFVILCYHGIGESGNRLCGAPPVEMFEAQMRFLSRNYRVVSLGEAFEELSCGANTEPGVAITFDDGYRSAYTAAFPVLQKYRLPATIYLTVDSVESGRPAWYDRVFTAMAIAPAGQLRLDFPVPMQFELRSFEDRLHAALRVIAHLRTLPNSQRRACSTILDAKIELPPSEQSGRVLTWQQIREMQEAGISFGSHTLSHPVVSQLDAAELQQELLDSKRILEEKLGRLVLDFAFPFGKISDCSPVAIQTLAQSGYRSAVTTVTGANTRHINSFELRRVQVGDQGSLARLAFDINMAFLRMEEPQLLVGSASPSSVVRPDEQPTRGRVAGGLHA